MLALELRNNLLHPLHDLHIPLHGTSMYQGINPQIGVSIVIRTDLGDLDLRMKCRLGGLLLIEYLLLQLLPVSPSREPDLDSLHPAQTDHTLFIYQSNDVLNFVFQMIVTRYIHNDYFTENKNNHLSS